MEAPARSLHSVAPVRLALHGQSGGDGTTRLPVPLNGEPPSRRLAPNPLPLPPFPHCRRHPPAHLREITAQDV
eukprot:scaffold11209_cov99-Isochrysis_galbana.AAC.1